MAPDWLDFDNPMRWTNNFLYLLVLLLGMLTFETCSQLDRINSRLWDVNDKLADVARAINTHRP